MPILHKIFSGFFLSLLIFSNKAISQVKVSCGTKLFVIQFSSDSSRSFNNSFVDSRIINNIKYSNNEVELRMYTTVGGLNHRLILIFVKHKGVASYKTVDILYSKSNAPIEGYNEITYKNFSAFVKTNDKLLGDKFCGDLDTLILHHFFTVQDEKISVGLNKELAKQNNLMDDKGTFFFELKIGNKLRNFNYSLGASKYINPEDINNIKKIIQIFYNEKPKT